MSRPKTARVLAARRLADGRRLVQIVCPACDGRHWTPASDAVQQCPRKRGIHFYITTLKRADLDDETHD